MRTRPFAVLVSIAVAACSQEPAGDAAAPARTGTPAPPSAAPPPPEAVAAPDDLDIAALKKALTCAADAKSGPCAVVNAFGSCKPWNPVVPSGDGRWIGRGYRVEGGKTSDEFTIVRSRRVPSNEVGPGQLPAKVGISDIAKQEGSAFSQADRLIRTLERSDVPPRSNMALDYLKKRASWPEGFTMKTVGGQVYVASEGGTFVCQGPKQELYLVQRAATRGKPGDGLYATAYPVSW
ncbi:hypothetical protein [Polyangium mundeleinium]|uniref:Lipoprotein n=1 Tax=Polyangium mundeleinium TaxID=2995306 RepID=A0ABT5F4X4_9BACT|nr:hypothetical protein [Polyangium mundeleinium]MDC0749136.1 hypothetical protein [Polyangium mundeleinium]